jgi:hypothetical protein
MKTILLLLTITSLSIINCVAQDIDIPVTVDQKIKTQQQYHLNPSSALTTRVGKTPDDVLKLFYDNGMSPKEHLLTNEEKKMVAAAFAKLLPLQLKVLKEHLQSISFLDDMPNTALTSSYNFTEPYRLYHITIRAAILKQNVSEWLTEKELTCFDTAQSDLTVSVDGGKMNALVYVLMHECSHVVDGSLGMFSEKGSFPENLWREAAQNFSKPVWVSRTKYIPAIQDSLLFRNHFRKGIILPVAQAETAYEALEKVPLVSLYSTSSWSEDLAEYVTVYNLTHRLHQPFKFVVKKKGKTIFEYAPMKSALVLSRAKIMDVFYLAKPG